MTRPRSAAGLHVRIKSSSARRLTSQCVQLLPAAAQSQSATARQSRAILCLSSMVARNMRASGRSEQQSDAVKRDTRARCCEMRACRSAMCRLTISTRVSESACPASKAISLICNLYECCPRRRRGQSLACRDCAARARPRRIAQSDDLLLISINAPAPHSWGAIPWLKLVTDPLLARLFRIPECLATHMQAHARPREVTCVTGTNFPPCPMCDYSHFTLVSAALRVDIQGYFDPTTAATST
jgi:hypothetical protein